MAVFYFLVEAEYFGFLNRQTCLRSLVCIGQVRLYSAQANGVLHCHNAVWVRTSYSLVHRKHSTAL
jgi:hypothetical protein